MTYIRKFIRQMQLIFEQKTAAKICSTDRKFHRKQNFPHVF